MSLRFSIRRGHVFVCFLFLCTAFLPSCSKSKKDVVNPTPSSINNAVVSTIAGVKATTNALTFTGPDGIVFDAAGNMYFVIRLSNIIYKIDKSGVISTFAGTGDTGFANGQGNQASFFLPNGLAIDASGNIYVADGGNFVIRKITPSGLVSTFAGTGNAATVDGTVTTASFGGVESITIDNAGNMYVGDTEVIRKITTDGIVSTIPGTKNSTTNVAQGNYAVYSGLTTDNVGNVYATDRLHFIIIKITPAGNVSTFAGKLNVHGHTDGTGESAILSYPTDLVFNPVTKNIYVTEQGPHDIRQITLDGTVTTLAGSGLMGDVDATGTAASFNYPAGIGVDAVGNIYVGDVDNNSIRLITASGIVITFAGKALSPQNGSAASSTFNHPKGVVVDVTNNVYIADAGNHIIRKISAGIVSTFAGTGSIGAADGPAHEASFADPTGLTIDVSGNFYVADSANNILRKITPLGQVTSIPLFVTTNGASGPSNYPTGITVDATGSIYYTNSTWNSICKINGGVTSTFSVGNNIGPTNGMFFNLPYAVTVDKNGNVYIADTGNSRICKVDAAGYETTIAGKTTEANLPVSGYADGNGIDAIFNHPQGLVVDSSGNIYVADTGNNLIRKIDPSGIVSTLAGSRAIGYADGAAAQASFNKPVGITISSNGKVLYVADSGNSLIRKIIIQ